MQTFYCKEIKAILDTQISIYFLENCVDTIKLQVEALQPGNERSSLQTFEALVKFYPDKDKPDPDPLMSEIETFNVHNDKRKVDVQNICGDAKKSEELALLFPLTNRACRLVLLLQ